MFRLQIHRYFWIALISLFAGWGCALAETITIGAEDDWAPYSVKTPEQARGFSVSVVREAFLAVGINVKFESMPYARCMDITRSGKLLGCFNAARGSNIENHYLWHDKPLFHAKIYIYALASSHQSDLTPQDLSGRFVGITHGYEYGDAVDTNTHIKRDAARQDKLGFKKLLAHRVEYMLAYEKVAETLFVTEPAFANKFKPVGLAAEPGLYMAISKTFPDSAKYLERFNTGLELIQKSGKYKELEIQSRCCIGNNLLTSSKMSRQ
jgi:polar amino acid transport system substrate-binding protein